MFNRIKHEKIYISQRLTITTTTTANNNNKQPGKNISIHYIYYKTK